MLYHIEWVNLHRVGTIRSENKNVDKISGVVDFRSYRFKKNFDFRYRPDVFVRTR